LEKRNLEQLVNEEQPAWPMLQGWVSEACNKVEVLPAGAERAAALLEAQVTTRSPMGAVIYETGGMLIDSGWIRLLGSGHEKLPGSLAEWNRSLGFDLLKGPPLMLIAFDAIGGPFVLDGGGLGRAGGVFYNGPENPEWHDTGLTYTEFLRFCLFGDLKAFYGELRWPGWENDLASTRGDHGFAFSPVLSALGPEVAERRRSVVPMAKLFSRILPTA
jgi:hypothetical protein